MCSRKVSERSWRPVTSFSSLRERARRMPASALQLHPHVTAVVDEAAAAGLRLAEYYRETYAGKPAWQAL